MMKESSTVWGHLTPGAGGKLQTGRSPGNDDEISIIRLLEYCTGGLVRSENEARILYTVLFCSLKVNIKKNLPPRRNYFPFF